MGESPNDWQLHLDIESKVPEAPGRIGYAALQDAIDVGQRGRVKRAVATLVGLDVLQWQGMRQGRAVAQGPRTLTDVLDAGLMPVPDREIQTYPLLAAPLDAYITQWHVGRGDPIDTSGASTAHGDGVTTYVTSSLRAGGTLASATHTRPDLTVVVDLEFAAFGSWNDVHAVEVKPYWAVTRSALFEAAAQAALHRCSFSWLLVWIPTPDPAHFRPDALKLIDTAESNVKGLAAEAKDLGLGFLIAESLDEAAELQEVTGPRRQVLEPKAANDLFVSLGRVDSTALSD